jgi:hypothetical protein
VELKPQLKRWLGAAGLAAILVALVGLRGALGQVEAPVVVVRAKAPLTAASGPAMTARVPAGTVGLSEAGVVAAGRKIDPQTDEFFERFDDLVPAMLTRNAAPCYAGGLGRKAMNQKLKLAFKTHIHDGEVSVTDVRVVESTLGDAALEACFVARVAASRWHDDELPEWGQDDELVIRPERGMKKYTESNMKYEGAGPTGAAVMTAQR